ncbi:efflux RND transporter periplasmic adaptor subunit [Ginsengibacter hankyongi]|uniref:Efflux RND transporter periplasmic adaptor subunit n=1 Tax=Ginsengibacter hankyongi TaxID=2607284 RepID=A0A5J5IKE7_9BACT|nr:efflux RND transporter periplasmic adaptor subunit [Ginsengibacter hankyongi]KAA9041038.1 efflux RND transporter periplasmic adaptor subunit [Ginsengibacter hankyongi]
MKLKYWKLLAGILFLFYISSCSNKSNDQSDLPKNIKRPGANASLAVEGYVVTPSVLNSKIDVAGTLLPFEETEIHPEVAGKVVMLSIKEGSVVKRGTLLARLFDGDLRAQLHKLAVQLEVADKTQARQDELLKIGGISQADYDLSVLSVSSIKADMQVLQASIDKTMIRAPFDGKIGFKNISIGAYVTPATIVTTIRQINKLKLEFSVPEKYTSKIALGRIVNFSTESSGKKYDAKIVATESGITEENRSLKVHAVVENVDNNITSGSFAKVNFDMGDDNNAIMIPTEAIIPQARDKKVIVYHNGVAGFNTVTTGVRDSARVEILKGINIGDTVITTGLLNIKPGSKISISSLKK